MKAIRFYLYSICMLILPSASLHAQNVSPDPEKILAKAMSWAESGKFALHFEALAYGLQKPQDIFSMPVYKKHEGGYYYNDGNKYELNTQVFKGVSDGSIMIFINEEEHSMVIDSIRNRQILQEEPSMNMLKAVAPELSEEYTLKYVGQETLKGIVCHKIQAVPKTEGGISSFYYVSQKDGRLVMLADYHDRIYDVYWIRKIDAPPANYNYTVKIPAKEVETLYGYEVFDLRFAISDLSK